MIKMASKEEVRVVDLRERCTLYATEANKFKKTGEEMNVSVHLKDHLIKTGMATEKKPAAKAEK